VEIEEVDEAQHQQNHANLRAETFQTFLRHYRRQTAFQSKRLVAYVNGIEPD